MSHGYYQGDGPPLAEPLVHWGQVTGPDSLATACGQVGIVSMKRPPSCPDCARKIAEAAARRTEERIAAARRRLAR